MASQRSAGNYKSAVGIVLVGLGIFILHRSLGCEVAGLRHSLCVNGCDELGTGPALALMAGRILHGIALDPARFLVAALRQALLTLWPLLLAKVGTILAQDAPAEPRESLEKKNSGLSISSPLVRRQSRGMEAQS
jgi:hypothetical protein